MTWRDAARSLSRWLSGAAEVRTVAAVTAVLVLGTGLAAVALRPAPVSTRIVQREIVGTVSTPYAAVVVVQPEECLSGLAFAHALARTTLRPLVTLRPLALVGSEDDLAAVDGVVYFEVEQFPIERASADLVKIVHAAGYQRTPILLVADTAGRLRLTAPLPKSPAGTRALIRQLEALPQ